MGVYCSVCRVKKDNFAKDGFPIEVSFPFYERPFVFHICDSKECKAKVMADINSLFEESQRIFMAEEMKKNKD